MGQPEGSDGQGVGAAGDHDESLKRSLRIHQALHFKSPDSIRTGSSFFSAPKGMTIPEWVSKQLRDGLNFLGIYAAVAEKAANTANNVDEAYRERMRVLVGALTNEFNHKNIKFPAERRMLVGGKDLPSSLEYRGGVSGEFIRGNVVGVEADAWSELHKGVITLTIKGTPVGALYLNIDVEDLHLLEVDEPVVA